jgi:hypothetical protein
MLSYRFSAFFKKFNFFFFRKTKRGRTIDSQKSIFLL